MSVTGCIELATLQNVDAILLAFHCAMHIRKKALFNTTSLSGSNDQYFRFPSDLNFISILIPSIHNQELQKSTIDVK